MPSTNQQEAVCISQKYRDTFHALSQKLQQSKIPMSQYVQVVQNMNHVFNELLHYYPQQILHEWAEAGPDVMWQRLSCLVRKHREGREGVSEATLRLTIDGFILWVSGGSNVAVSAAASKSVASDARTPAAKQENETSTSTSTTTKAKRRRIADWQAPRKRIDLTQVKGCESETQKRCEPEIQEGMTCYGLQQGP